ncbi:hypothetical protein [Daejeonella oryzae]|uniref:hypothetical protein n=1 Tax=Daejeonella oryzae TaxID=1122943 RepID=UPI0012DDD563|nr:hypothetical protein [Daejeonella oryzae]
MKQIIYLSAILAMLSCNNHPPANEESAKETPTTISKSPESSSKALNKIQTVDGIKAAYSSIISKIAMKNMDSISFKYNCNGEKTGKVLYFIENGKVRLIKHTYNEYSHFSATEQYFINDGEVFFVLYNHVSWSFVDQDKTKDDITEKRFYVINNNPVKCLQNKSTVISSSGKAGKPTVVSNNEIECSSFEPALKQFNTLIKLSGQRKDLKCLE